MYCVQTINNSPILSSVQPNFSPSNVWIHVQYAGLCRTDVQVANGLIPVPNDRILGHECSGVVCYAPPDSGLVRGTPVTINPTFESGFLGIDRNGAFAEQLEVPESMVIPLPLDLDLRKAAFTEPVAAALAVLECDIDTKEKGLVLGKGRIAALTFEILRTHGFQSIVCSQEIKDDNYDFIIETNLVKSNVEQILSALKRNGTLIVKSRTHTNVSIPTHVIVKKQLRIQGALYGSFQKAIQVLLKDDINCEQFFGNTYGIHEFIHHFDELEDYKIFCSPNDTGVPCAES